MLKIVAVTDKQGTAIDRLAQGVAEYHDNLDYVVCDVHPKRPDQQQIDRFVKEAMDADIIHWEYFRSAEMLREKLPWLEGKKQILSHYNPYSIKESDWNGYDYVIGCNEEIYKNLGEITQSPTRLIPLTIDTDFWTYNMDWQPRDAVLMVANRIESKKGILEVAIATAELDLKFVLVGAISDLNYYRAIEATGNVQFFEKVSDEQLRELYHKSLLHVCNSVDNFESGTLPILEAMLCGTPVMTRKVGHVPELNNGENMVIYDGKPEDVMAIKEKLFEAISDHKKLAEIRDKAWQTAKTRSNERRAYEYQKLYREVMNPMEIPVSVVVPIYDKPEVIRECLNAIANQSYKNLELIVVDDSPDMSGQEVVANFVKFVSFPVRYMDSNQNDYGLARARNLGTIEATGEIMVYCDQRIIMQPDCIEEFVKYAKPKYWLYGNKGARKEFVENLSSIYRQDIINAGMFNERINLYGGQSQELRVRVRRQGYKTEFIESAKGEQRGKSSNRNRKRQEIIKMKTKLWKMNLETN